MKILMIHGGRPLHGKVTVPGAKNSVLPLLAASLLSPSPSRFTNVPQLSDVDAAQQILRTLGAYTARDSDAFTVMPPRRVQNQIPPELMRSMRSSVFFLAPMLVRAGSAVIHTPGGCALGARPIDIHLEGLARMGAQVDIQPQKTTVRAPQGLRGSDFTLRFPSVGATETLLMAAVCAKGASVLRNAACEPEVTDLAQYLLRCGAQIFGVGTPTLRILGTRNLHGALYRVCADRIIAATLLCAVAGCGGSADITDFPMHACAAVHRVLCRAGCSLRLVGARTVRFTAPPRLHGGGRWLTAVYPGLPTDAVPLLAAAFLRAKGDTRLTDTVFSQRFACRDGFTALGAQTELQENALTVHGVRNLYGATVDAADLRGGAALTLAALQAQGVSAVCGVRHIRRGYPDIAAMLAALGADIRWVQTQHMPAAVR